MVKAPFYKDLVSLRGLRDDFRTLDWVEVVGGLNVKRLKYLNFA